MLFGILDVIMRHINFIHENQEGLRDKEAKTEFLRRVLCEARYRVVGRFLRIEEGEYMATTWVEDEEGERYAEVTAVFREAKSISLVDFVESLDFSFTSPERYGTFFIRPLKNGAGKLRKTASVRIC